MPLSSPIGWQCTHPDRKRKKEKRKKEKKEKKKKKKKRREGKGNWLITPLPLTAH
jgi:hypothetical protein